MKKIYYFHDSEGITNDSVEEDITFLYNEVRLLRFLFISACEDDFPDYILSKIYSMTEQLVDEVRCLYNQLYFYALTDEQFNIVLALGSGRNAGDNRPA